MKLPYQLNYEDKTIALTRKFASESSVSNSAQYKLLMRLKADFPDYRIEVRTAEKNHKKQKYKGLSYKAMFEHIRKAHSEEAMNDFQFQMDLNGNESGA